MARLFPLATAAVAALAGGLMTVPAAAEGEVIRIQRNPNAIILEAARVNAGADVIYVSGQLPSPLDPAMPMSEVTSLEQMGDTRAQTVSTLAKIADVLATQGFTMGDVVKLQLMVVADPATGVMDFAGVNAGFREFFGTEENPLTTARSTFEVAGLVGPHFLIEIDAIAARAPQD
ncbi:Rid family hydrolase [Altererythrobacter sp. KTW20L]|uniref:Rid family hydrolase n=1 Tax=Altererythrobacter sp. KTW20L TaxID=2942210 RepID=UPI0020C017B3|nr:Rid family hydrolase [Altererythrobacter sp. KTW20L]MCL6251583.1 Rid family hydrolase [Altererythrobacter sp. KTW20L]